MLAQISKAVFSFQKITDKLMSQCFDKIWVRLGITPNILTLSRFIGTGILWVLFLTETTASDFWNYTILTIFIISALTDLWDGALARNTNQITDIGTILDPLADKLLIGSILYFLAITLSHWTLYMIIFLESLMVALNMIFYMLWGGKIQSANAFGKLKMGLEVITVILLLVGIYQKNPYIVDAGFFFGAISVLFAIISMLKAMKDGGSAF
ncbi:CDP-alcohol phosphatidyltransferase family protein [Candidatus Gracilibacteria bacterium]|nr:CDP-alcohol phosphatidyltransferase family protein [Candidatus Gracilibacteria bacterium]